MFCIQVEIKISISIMVHVPDADMYNYLEFALTRSAQLIFQRS